MSEIKALEKLRECANHESAGFFVNLEQAFGLSRYKCGDSTIKPSGAAILNAIADEIEAEIADNYMRLPCDVDGVPIHVGEHVRGKYTDDKTLYKVHGFMFDFEHGQCNIALNESRFASSNLLVRCEPRTLEDVLNDFGRKFAENYHYPNADGLVDKTADEIRELMEEGGE